jgi:hypothetical protein
MKRLLIALTCMSMGLASVALAKDAFPDRLLLDNFSDGDYTNDPEWTVARGSFSVEDGKLISVVGKSKKDDSADTSFEGDSWEELTNPSSNEGTTTTNPPALIYTQTELSNAFSLRLKHRFVDGKGNVVIGVYQKRRGKLGYRIVVNPRRVVRLVRLGETQGRVVVKEVPLNLENDDVHKIVWSRFSNGRHVVRIDEQKILEVVDPYFKQPFDGFFILNRSGEQHIHRIAARGRQ